MPPKRLKARLVLKIPLHCAVRQGQYLGLNECNRGPHLRLDGRDPSHHRLVCRIGSVFREAKKGVRAHSEHPHHEPFRCLQALKQRHCPFRKPPAECRHRWDIAQRSVELVLPIVGCWEQILQFPCVIHRHVRAPKSPHTTLPFPVVFCSSLPAVFLRALAYQFISTVLAE